MTSHRADTSPHSIDFIRNLLKFTKEVNYLINFSYPELINWDLAQLGEGEYYIGLEIEIRHSKYN